MRGTLTSWLPKKTFSAEVVPNQVPLHHDAPHDAPPVQRHLLHLRRPRLQGEPEAFKSFARQYVPI